MLVANTFDMTPPGWAAAYLRSLAAWAVDNRPLAARVPSGPPECVVEDMAVAGRETHCQLARTRCPW
jgi:hypothetical protein